MFKRERPILPVIASRDVLHDLFKREDDDAIPRISLALEPPIPGRSAQSHMLYHSPVFPGVPTQPSNDRH